jgi:ABC-type transporter Mla MlaB component
VGFIFRLAQRLHFFTPGVAMLRISTIETTGEKVKIQIDGQLSAEWVKLLRKMCETHLEKGLQVSIDLRNVSFADRDGIAILQKLSNYNVEFFNASPFLAEQIRKPGD